MSPEDFNFIAAMLKEKSGLALSQDKGYLMESRLMPVARKNGMSSLEELVEAIKGKDLALQLEVVEAMTTNESFFFRDSKPFNQFKELVLPTLLKSRATKKSIRIWSAACSSGQEPYSLAMILREHASELAGWKIEIVATDISQDIIDKAVKGEYTQFEVQRGLPVQYLIKHFKKDGESWNIAQDIKSMVQFKKWNLLDDYKPLGTFDVVFCRNVLIYFDQPTKTKVLSKIAGSMAEDGFLYLGGAETVLGISNKFKPVPGQRGIYAVDPTGSATAVMGTNSFGVNANAGAAMPGIKAPTTGLARPGMPPSTSSILNRPTTAIKAPTTGATSVPRPNIAPRTNTLGTTTGTTQAAARPTIGARPTTTTTTGTSSLNRTTTSTTGQSTLNNPQGTNRFATSATTSTTSAQRPATSSLTTARTTTTSNTPTTTTLNRTSSPTTLNRPTSSTTSQSTSTGLNTAARTATQSTNTGLNTTTRTAAQSTSTGINTATRTTTPSSFSANRPTGTTAPAGTTTTVNSAGQTVTERVETSVNEKGQTVRKIIKTVIKKAE